MLSQKPNWAPGSLDNVSCNRLSTESELLLDVKSDNKFEVVDVFCVDASELVNELINALLELFVFDPY